MTRGKLVIILPYGGFKTNEYNGDMYMNQDEFGPKAKPSPGDIARKKIEEPTDFDSFTSMVRDFTTYYYGPEYANCPLTDEELEYKSSVHALQSPAIDENQEIHFSDYYTHWFSDYIYIKNASGKQINIYTTDGDTMTLDDGQSEVFYFGNVYKKEDEDVY